MVRSIPVRSVTSVEAQNRFGELIDAAQREPVSITRRGRTVAFVVSPADLEELIDARRGRVAAVAAYDEYLRRVSGRLSAEAAMLDDTAVAALVEEAHLEQPPAGLPA
jgi:prevent-host-death family protein